MTLENVNLTVLVYFLTTFTTTKKNTGKKLTYPVKKQNVILPF